MNSKSNPQIGQKILHWLCGGDRLFYGAANALVVLHCSFGGQPAVGGYSIRPMMAHVLFEGRFLSENAELALDRLILAAATAAKL